ncbi:COX assembly mitochondrial protein 2 [Tanacetum coccineum]
MISQSFRYVKYCERKAEMCLERFKIISNYMLCIIDGGRRAGVVTESSRLKWIKLNVALVFLLDPRGGIRGSTGGFTTPSYLMKYYGATCTMHAYELMDSVNVVGAIHIAVQIIELFQKCHNDHPYGKFFGECTDLKIKLDKCFRQEKAVKRKANFEESKKLKERLQTLRKEAAETENHKGKKDNSCLFVGTVLVSFPYASDQVSVA